MDSPRSIPGQLESLAESRAVCYRFLAQSILFDPSPAMLESLRGLDTLAWTGEAGYGGPAGALVTDGLSEIREALAQVDGESLQTLSMELSRQRTRLFRGLSPGYGAPPPYEALHRARHGEPEMETLLAVQEIFAEAGADLAGLTDRPDYLGLELELMGFLCEEEARLRVSGEDAEQAAILQNRLLSQHLLRWVPPYCLLLRKEAGAGFYAGVSKVLEGFLNDEATRLAAAENTLLSL